ncbi:unnamed protein product [Microthlaspi erraticum]|uniref:Uncharacterized protein n=1 Tax=Microthlaspi erraticum TaxID=1685480 RepID=A0A6D2IBL5_9BRAS|nr:unnamed protein product [Microthlaspi erraticum]
MKPGTKRSATARRRINDDDGAYSPFNMSSLKHEIDAVDAAKERRINLSSLAVALSAASREMKQTEKSQRKRVKDSRRRKKQLLIGAKPETQAELRRWFSDLDESFRRSLMENKCNVAAYKVTPKTLMEPQICGFNTDFTMNHCSEAFF